MKLNDLNEKSLVIKKTALSFQKLKKLQQPVKKFHF
ncbi:hypothetical protein VCB_001335 [Vibrio cholerae TMA 21]|nr:hypothetical protein VCB_001335 [Vibrio cholerae TMA 21]